MTEEEKKITAKDQAQARRTSAFIKELWRHKTVFALGVMLAVPFFWVVKRTLPEGTSKYFAKVSAKYDRDGNKKILAGDGGLRTYSPLWQQFTRVGTEDLFKVISSTTTIEAAGRLTNYRVEYFQKRFIGKKDIWDKRPYDIYFLSAGDDEEFSTYAKQVKGGVVLSGMQRTEPKAEKIDGTVFIPFGKETVTPLGAVRVVLRPAPVNKVDSLLRSEAPESILIQNRQEYTARMQFDTGLEQYLEHGQISLSLEVNCNRAFAVAFIDSLIKAADTKLHERWLADVRETNALIDTCLFDLRNNTRTPAISEARILTLTGEQVSLQSRNELLLRLEQVRAENAIDANFLHDVSLVQVLDPGHISEPKSSNTVLLAAIFLLLGLLVPVLYYYVRYVLGRRVLTPEEAEEALSAGSVAELFGADNGSLADGRALALARMKIDRLCDTNTRENKRRPMFILLTSASAVCDCKSPAIGLTAAYRGTGRKVLLLTFEENTCIGNDGQACREICSLSDLTTPDGRQKFMNAIASYDCVVTDCPSILESNAAFILEEEIDCLVWVVEHLRDRVDHLEVAGLQFCSTSSVIIYRHS